MQLLKISHCGVPPLRFLLDTAFRHHKNKVAPGEFNAIIKKTKIVNSFTNTSRRMFYA
jgi:hypothetical protein